MMDELLDILRSNARETPESIAKMLDIETAEVKARMAEYEKTGVIRGYQAIIDEEKVSSDSVTARTS